MGSPKQGDVPRIVLAALAAVAFGCEGSPTLQPSLARLAASPSSRMMTTPAVRTQLDGRRFPDKVVALTWDDGPDANTLALAAYLSREHVSATFFVVHEWAGGLSAEPGSGKDEFETGYEYLPILGDLVQLGHRVGNHTLNHVLLSQARPELLDRELRDNQENIDPFLTNELRIFRAPGGAWSAPASRVTDADPYLLDLVGPVRWDIDRKDWESSLDCRSAHPLAECEPAGPGHRSRVKPQVVAQRYLSSIEEAGHGVVLFHDRVGDVGSKYALQVAEHVVPELRARGFVFVAPVLGFGEPAPRLAPIQGDEAPALATMASLRIADLDGDGRADACIHAPGARRCARSVELAGTEEDRRPRTVFDDGADAGGAFASCAAPFESEDIELADVNGDGRADVCAKMGFGIACAVVERSGECGPVLKWSLFQDQVGAHAGRETADAPIRFGDLDGDGKADVCQPSALGLVCALSSGKAFGQERVWAPLSGGDGWLSSDTTRWLALADVNGDGRADACGRGASGVVVCALSTGKSFAPVEPWTTGDELKAASWLGVGDLNGDQRADVCGFVEGRILCALSTGRGFTNGTVWFSAGASEEAGRLLAGASLALGDVNGDRRADLCGYGSDGVLCAMAP
jgi:peptidoglycan/xylan/chitin deacetylase (PgdA/CDA1 family)